MTDHDGLRAHCRTCVFWRPGKPPIAVATRMAGDPNPNLGVCEFDPPTVHVVGGAAISLFPAVHADRCCFQWMPDDPHQAPQGPGRGSNVIPVDFGSAA